MTAAVLIALAAVYFFFDPNTEGVFPKCAFYVLTGWKCPGCGSQRALHALLHGDITGAFHMNMWIPVAAIYIVLVMIALFFSNRNSRYSKIVTNDYLFATFQVRYTLHLKQSFYCFYIANAIRCTFYRYSLEDNLTSK